MAPQDLNVDGVTLESMIIDSIYADDTTLMAESEEEL